MSKLLLTAEIKMISWRYIRSEELDERKTSFLATWWRDVVAPACGHGRDGLCADQLVSDAILGRHPRCGVCSASRDRLSERIADREPERGPSPPAFRNLCWNAARSRISLGKPVHYQANDFTAHTEFRDGQIEGKRFGRQSHRNRGRGGVAGGGYGRGGLPGRQLRNLCASAERERVAHDGDFVRLRFARRRPNELAKPHRGDCSGTTKGNPGALGESRSAGGGSAHQPSGIRRGNCRSDAAAATSVGNHRSEADDRRGRREHRADGARPTVGTKGGGTRSGTPCGDGEQFIGRVVRRAQPAAGGQRWDALQLGARWGSANHFFCGSIVRRTTLWKGGPRMNCAA